MKLTDETLLQRRPLLVTALKVEVDSGQRVCLV